MYTLESNILKTTGINAKQLQNAMRQIRPDNRLNVLAVHAVHAEKKYGISALWIVAHAATETGWGKSLIAQTRNNFFGFNAIDSNPRNATKYKTAQGSVEHYADFLKTHYLTKGGKYFNGPTPHGVMVRYASAGDRAAKTIVQIMNMLAERIGPKQPDGFPQKEEKKPTAANPELNNGKITIKEGDTMWDLENKYKWEHGTLQEANPDVDPKKLQIGQELHSPSHSGELSKKNEQNPSQSQNQNESTPPTTNVDGAENSANDTPTSAVDPKKN